MAEVKNSFLASKMNKDLDSRLVPNNQYRNAFNIAVSESEDSDVGALENILGNSLIATATGFGTNPTVIGYGVDEINEKIFLFITDYTDTSPTNLTNNQAAVNQGVSSIVCLDVQNNANAFQTLVTGRFLNLSTTHPIYGVNILEGLLFWTDNRNQPRKININKAISSSSYYATEDSISVARYAPYQSIELVTENAGVYTGTMKDVVSPSSIGGAAAYATSVVSNATVIPINTTYGTFATDDVITLQPPNVDKIPAGTKVAGSSTSTSLNTNVPVGVTTPLDANDVIVFSENPYFINDYAGDPVFLQDKFVKFSYRFKYDDNEYSIIAPFTQTAFIPQQDGRFLIGDEEASYTSGEVSFMQNKVNFIELIINFPDAVTGANLNSNFKITEIDVIYQESDGIALYVLDTITLDDITTSHPSDTFYKYKYQSRKPILTLPSSEANRVYDKTPVKALSQEVSGNRVIYGNYVNKYTAPQHLNYQVTASEKIEAGSLYTGIDKEYPESTLKRNRNYQVGIVLMDRYGRQSDVILSNVGSNTASNDLTNSFGASTFYFPYRNNNTVGDVLNDIGNSIKIQFNKAISSNFSPLQYGNSQPTGQPGLYNGVLGNAAYNPLGWYTYKVVVKQTEQDYYNVYTPGIVNGEFNIASANSGFAFTTLISDSLNKVPKELLDASGNQNQFRSDTLLYNVVNTAGTAPNYYNIQGFPGNTNNTVTTLSTFTDMGGTTGTNDEAVFQVATNPFLAKLATPISLGGIYATNFNFNLTVFETDPFVSNIDIYYETSTTGLISELNTAIGQGGGDTSIGFTALAYLQNENQNPAGTGNSTGAADSPYVTATFQPIDQASQQIDDSEITNFAVVDGGGNNRSSDFDLELDTTSGDDRYRIKINSSSAGFYFGPNAATIEAYTFSMDVRNNEDNATASSTLAVSNSTTITVNNLTDGTASNGIFPGMQVLLTASLSTIIGTIDVVTAGGQSGDTTATFNLVNPGNVNAGTGLTFKAPFVNLEVSGVLSNNDPIIETYNLITPQYSTMPIFTGTVVGKNGSFNTSKNTLNLTWGFTAAQGAVTAAGDTFIVNNTPQGSDNATLQITRGSNISESVTIQIDQNTGALSRSSGTFWSDLTIVINLTDAGGATVTKSIDLLVEPGAFTDAFSTAFDI